MPGIRSARAIWVTCAALLALALSSLPAAATSRIKDLANLEGVVEEHPVEPVGGKVP